MHRILVVDDEPDIRRLVKEALTVSGYQVETAADGDEAVRRGALMLPDLVLLDIMMPKEDGFAVYERLRAKPAGLVCPIIFLTARREIDDKLAGFQAGRRGLHHQALPHQGARGPRQGPSRRAGSAQGGRAQSADGARARDRTPAVQRQDVQAGSSRSDSLAEHTVRNHLHNVYRKLNVVDRAQAVIVSRENGWV